MSNGSGAHASTVAKSIPSVVADLKALESPLGLVLSDMRLGERTGDVIDAISEGEPKHIKDGYQYVGGFPAHLWKLATADDHYQTLSYGIKNFHNPWRALRRHLTKPYHYVSIGPGTGEKDQMILRHLESMPGTETIVYVPVDISPQLLRMATDVAMRGVDTDRIEVLPLELDITNSDALAGLRVVIEALASHDDILISLLGNTLANFRRDREMLSELSSLLASTRDLLFLEIATTDDATKRSAAQAAKEYRGSPLFREFAMATLCEYTDITMKSGRVQSDAQVVDDTLQIVTRFSSDERLPVNVKNGNHFILAPDEPIELYISRKYTTSARKSLLEAFDLKDQHQSTFSAPFGIATYLLSLKDEPASRRAGSHPVGHVD